MSNQIYLDTAFVNGSVMTVDQKDTLVHAAGIIGNRIAFVGSNEDIREWIGENTQVVDLHGRSLLPGFNDTHFHPILKGVIGPDPDSAQISTWECSSKKELLELIRQVAVRKKPGEWISLDGFVTPWETDRPTLDELDTAAPLNPVHCMHGSGHVAVYNSLALRTIGLVDAKDAVRFPTDEVEVAGGKLTGLLRGNTHTACMSHVNYRDSQLASAALKSQELALQNGICSIGDMGEYGKSSYHIMQKLCRTGDIKLRVNMALHNVFGKQFSIDENDYFWGKLGLMTGLGDEHFRIGPAKIMIDGGSSVPSCATREPYSHKPDGVRERAWERDEVRDYILKIQEAECQATAHAIGDLAVEFMVEAYEACYARDPGKTKALRHRIEHCTVTDQDLINRMAAMGICPSVNAALIGINGAKYTRFFGPERAKYLCPLRSMLDAGIMCSLHSDVPSGPCGLDAIDAAVNRYDRQENYQCDRTQAVTVAEAVRCYTYNAAWSTFEENIKGSIEPGKLADLVILSGDILSVDPMDIPSLKVDETIIDGKSVYRRE